MPSDEENTINLEHILPENPDKNWPGIDQDTASAFYRRIGNLVILQAKKNSLIGNGSFKEKKGVLAASAFHLTASVGTFDSWGPKEIVERQKQLARLAVQTWPLISS